MADQLYQLFYNATRDVFSLMLDLENISAITDDRQATTSSDGKLNIAIGVTGDLQGEIVYHFPKDTTLEMVKIMSGMDFAEIDDFVTSAIGEITNIISGKALIALSEQKVTCDILPPKFGVDAPVCSEATLISTSTRISTDIGAIDLDIRLQSGQA